MPYSNELYHYGVLGMKWGVHKARSYAQDTSSYRMRKKNRAAKADYKAGKITKAQYKTAKKQNKYAKEDEDIQTNIKLKGVKRKDPDKGIDSIYKSYKDTAYSEIPDYAIKRGARTAAKVLAVAGAVAVGRAMHNRWVNTAKAAGREYANSEFYNFASKSAKDNAAFFTTNTNYGSGGVSNSMSTGIDWGMMKKAKEYGKAAEYHKKVGDALVNRAGKQYAQSRAYTIGTGAAAAGHAITSHKRKTRTKARKRK